MSEKVESPLGFMETVTIVEEVYKNRYGEERVKRGEVGSSRVFRAKGASDRIKVSSAGRNAEMVVDDTDSGTLGQIQSRLEDASGGSSSHTSTSTSTGTPSSNRAEPSAGSTATSSNTGQSGPNTVREVYSDGYIEFLPPETKEDAGYIQPGNPDFDRPHKRCEDCAHYIEGGGCHIVQGEIDPEAYCERFYADVGAFGNAQATPNLVIWGDTFDWSRGDLERFLEDTKEWLMERA